MNCKQAQALMSVYVDKELSTVETSTLETHLATCQLCQAEVQQISRTWELLGSLETIEPSPNFKARFWEKVREEEAKPGFWEWVGWLRPVPALAGVMALWFLGITGGISLYESHAAPRTAGSRTALKIFTSPYPLNSIEQIYLQGSANFEDGRRG